jgi:predicted amidophosphoribosyltransferase
VPYRADHRLLAAVATLSDLVLPGGCAGCDGAAGLPLRRGACPACVETVAAMRPHPTRPDPAPDGLPVCAALGDYEGVLRELILSYKERGRHPLGRPLGRLLAPVVASLTSGPALLVPVPDTAAAARARYGDHLLRMARAAAIRLRDAGQEAVVARPLRVRPRPDSAGLDTSQRAAQAQAAFRVRPLRVAGACRWLRRTGGLVILLDDVITTGATLAAASARLAAAGLPVAGAAVLAATQRSSRMAPPAALKAVTRPGDPAAVSRAQRALREDGLGGRGDVAQHRG